MEAVSMAAAVAAAVAGTSLALTYGEELAALEKMAQPPGPHLHLELSLGTVTDGVVLVA